MRLRPQAHPVRTLGERVTPAMSWRQVAKRALELGLERGGVAALSRWLARRGTLVLAYHDIVPDNAGEPLLGAGDRSLHLPQRAFAEQLDALVATHEVVSLECALEEALGRGVAAARRQARRARVAITFDDAYQGAVTSGVEELARRGLPATIFVAPAFVGAGTFWWDALATRHSRGLDPAVRARALHECRGLDADVRRWADSHGVARCELPPHARCASEEELARAAARPGITLASHSWSHANLTRLETAELHDELQRPLAWLRERFTDVCPVLSYPYGLSSPAVERAAAHAGYRAAMRISGGWLRAGEASAYALPRLDVPAGLSRAGFALRAAGVVGA